MSGCLTKQSSILLGFHLIWARLVRVRYGIEGEVRIVDENRGQ